LGFIAPAIKYVKGLACEEARRGWSLSRPQHMTADVANALILYRPATPVNR
jgi:hypothetical protein